MAQDKSNPTASAMTSAAAAFVQSLSAEPQSRAILPFEEEERFNWHYVPRERRGLPFKEMSEAQRERAHAFLQAGLSQAGYHKTTTIISLEEVLRELEGGKGPVRDPELYFFTLFGQPSE